MNLKNKTLFVTAGASGMGRSFAEYIARSGGNVIIADVDLAAAEALVASLPSAVAVACDVSDTDQVERARDIALERFGSVDLVMSHAGITQPGALGDLTDAAWTKVFDVNVIGMARVLRAFTPHLIERGTGHIVLTSSSLALIGGHPLSGRTAPYVASKAAVIGLAQAAAVAFAPHGVGVTLFVPDLTDTGFAKPPAGAVLPINPALASLVALNKQSPDDAVAVLIEAIEHGRFLASATPDHARLLKRQAEALLDPLALADENRPSERRSPALNEQ
jgi:NAD(P)-dependent dehydrogenase (short-subunit alcohol dehydrogenase family)